MECEGEGRERFLIRGKLTEGPIVANSELRELTAKRAANRAGLVRSRPGEDHRYSPELAPLAPPELALREAATHLGSLHSKDCGSPRRSHCWVMK